MTDRLWKGTLFLALLSEVFSGAARFYFGSLGGGGLVYAPKVFMALYILFFVITKFDSVALMLVVGVIFSALIGILNGVTRGAIGFQLWIVLPLIFGLFAPKRIALAEPPYVGEWQLAIVFLLGAVGVIINYYIEFPWSNSVFDVGGYSVEANKLSYAGESVRLTGFGRTSASTGLTLAVLAVWLICRGQSKIRNSIYALTVMGALALTTNKTSILALVLVICVHYLGRRRIAAKARWIAFFVQMGLPFFSLVAVASVNIGDGGYSIYSSFLDRIFGTWPEILCGLYKTDHLWFGLGLGGFGSVTEYFKSDVSFNTEYADNSALYIMATWGVLGLCSYIVLFCWLEGRRNILLKTEGSMILFLLLAGMTTDVLESLSCQLALGMSLIGVIRSLNRTAGRADG